MASSATAAALKPRNDSTFSENTPASVATGKWAPRPNQNHRVPSSSNNFDNWARSLPTNAASNPPSAGLQSRRGASSHLRPASETNGLSPRSGASSNDMGKWARPPSLPSLSRIPPQNHGQDDHTQRADAERKSTARAAYPRISHEYDVSHEHGHRHRDAQRTAGIGSAPSPFSSLDSQPRSRINRDEYKRRGSLLSRVHEDVAIEGHSRIHASTRPSGPARKKRSKSLNVVPVDIYIPSFCSVGNLARLLNVKLEKLQRKMVEAGMGSESSYDHVLTSEYASLLAAEFDRNPIVNDEAAFDIYPPPLPADMSGLPSRPPVVTIMGHVDHGKTTLLDTLRSASVAKGEAGGITQHIGAFSVPVPSLSTATPSGGPKSITFLDTPGHAAFSAMRARGARVTDVVVLVVAADDGVKPQTKEVIELIKRDEGKVGVVVAINKVDKPGADVEKVKRELLIEGIQLESYGGDIPSVEVSGLTGKGLDTLVETISAIAEMQDLRAEHDGMVQGHVLESRVQKGLGPVATVLVQRGCLKPGTPIICGKTSGKVRILTNSLGKSVKSAFPGDAVTVSGWKEVPSAGDEVLSASESDIKKAVANRLRKAEQDAALVDLEAINTARRMERERREAEEAVGSDGREERALKVDGPKELRLVIKGDVSGSVEAVAGALEDIGNNLARVKIISTGVGDVTESDVQLAQSAQGIIVAFSVNTPRAVEQVATQVGVPISSSGIIYQLMDDIKQRVIALLPVTIEKRVTGEATVLQLFDIQLKQKQVMKVAGCRVINGVLEKDKSARVIRDGEVIFEGVFETMKQLKKDVTDIRKGSDCGLSLKGFDSFKEGDMIQTIQEVEKAGQL